MGIFDLFSKKEPPIKEKIKRPPHPVALIIMDGYGISPISENNGVWQAKSPNLEGYQKKYPKALIYSSSNEVGLPFGEFGNSEVGHLNIGAGRIVYQPLLRVSKEIEEGHLEDNETMLELKKHVSKKTASLHLLGLLSNGGAHSHIDHLFSLLEWCQKSKIKRIFLHLFTDGRDSPPESAEVFISDLRSKIKTLGINAQIASLCGRFYAMDREKNWDRTKKAYDAIMGTSRSKTDNIEEVLQENYNKNKTDEFLGCFTITDSKNHPVATINDGDGLLFFNIRPDRARQIVSAFTSNTFNGFKVRRFKDLYTANLTEYDPKIKAHVIFPEENIKDPIAEVLSRHNKKQFHIAESVKYPHVTYFFNGGTERPYPGETRALIPSIDASKYLLKPEMGAPRIAERVLEELDKNKEDFYVINFANPDMIGHTGNLKAVKKGIEAVDEAIGVIVNKVLTIGGAIFITSDHGNAEELVNSQTGEVDTEHNTYPSPFILVMHGLENKTPTLSFKEMISEPIGALADVAPTILDLMQIEKPKDMTGISLLNSLK